MTQNTVIIADLHLHHVPKWRVQWQQDFCRHIISKYGNADAPLVLAGDVFEIRNRLEASVLNTFLSFVGEWQGNVYWITGQHDSYLPGISTLEQLPTICPKLTIVDRAPMHVPQLNAWLVPYARTLEEYRQFLQMVPDGMVVYTHIPTMEAVPFANEETNISAKEFDRFKLVISGDIHNWKNIGNLRYVGAPGQRDWRDEGVEGQIGFFDGVTFWREKTNHPMHVTLNDVEQAKRLSLTSEQVILRGAPSVLAAASEHENVLARVESFERKGDAVRVIAKSEETLVNEYVREKISDEELSTLYVEKGMQLLDELD